MYSIINLFTSIIAFDLICDNYITIFHGIIITRNLAGIILYDIRYMIYNIILIS